jgi:hypothetical protein
MRVLIPAALTGLLASPAVAADLNVKIDLPKLNVAEYHKPYVAVWVERPDQSVAANLSVWYDVKKPDNAGTKWLKDMRQWWRHIGRELTLPIDGVTGATQAPGEHQLAFQGGKSPLGDLPAGDYKLVVEAAREGGGREVVRVPFQWPPKAAQTVNTKGVDELGAVALNLTP